MVWICSNWTVDWNAIAAVSTLLAVIVALMFGLREGYERFKDRRSRRAMVSTALLHAVAIVRQQAEVNRESMAPERLDAHRPKLTEYGRALRIHGAEEIERQSGAVSVLGEVCASHFSYGLGLLQESNHFFTWLSELNEVNDRVWEGLKGQFSVRAESLSQAAQALRALETNMVKYVPERILVLRHGADWRQYFDPAIPNPIMVVRPN